MEQIHCEGCNEDRDITEFRLVDVGVVSDICNSCVYKHNEEHS